MLTLSHLLLATLLLTLTPPPCPALSLYHKHHLLDSKAFLLKTILALKDDHIQLAPLERSDLTEGSGGKTSQHNIPVPAPEDVLRPLENMADRFMRSNTVGMVDTIAARAIELVSSLVNGTSLVLVDMIDDLPRTIDRVSDVVDGIVTTADNIGREVAVVVTSPVRRLHTEIETRRNLSAARAEAESFPILARSADAQLQSALDDRASKLWESFQQRNNIHQNLSQEQENQFLRALLNMRPRAVASARLSTDAVDGADIDAETTLAKAIGDTDLTIIEDPELASPEQRRRPFFSFSLPANRTNKGKPVSPLIRGFGTIVGGNILLRAEKRRNASYYEEKRDPTVIEKNFQSSKTQASIHKLEDQFGGFLGRLLASFYLNADTIDDSVSGGIKRVLRLEERTAPPPSTTEPTKEAAELHKSVEALH